MFVFLISRSFFFRIVLLVPSPARPLQPFKLEVEWRNPDADSFNMHQGVLPRPLICNCVRFRYTPFLSTCHPESLGSSLGETAG
jgi:hypothetical protein